MRPRESQTGPVIQCLGELDIDGNRAVVTWPQLGDGIALDFPDRRSRFGVVVDLDRDPRLKIEPHYANLLDLEGRLYLLERVSSMWIRRSLQDAGEMPEPLR